MDRQLYLERKFGGPDQIGRVYAPVKAAGEAEGIPFAFEKITRSPNTLNAHRLIRWAYGLGRQDAMVERLFRLYFLEGANLTDKAVLAQAAEDAGLERPVVERLLEGDADKAEVTQEIEEAQRIGVTGVPTFLIASRYAVIGAREPEVIAGAIAKAAEELERGPAAHIGQ
jgi:predicted DsbA family dithiol-disulfide isomerase